MRGTLVLFPALLVIFVCSTVPSWAQCVNGGLFSNGDFTGPEGTQAAPGWTGTISPDINDDTGPLNSTPGYVWVGTPLISPNGGTWQNLWGTEAVAQAVATDPGHVYQICFWYAAQSIVLPGQFTFDAPVGITVSVNGAPVHTTPLDTTDYTWEQDCTTFIATSNTSVVSFSPSTMNYVAIDGACMMAIEPTAMEPCAAGTSFGSVLVSNGGGTTIHDAPLFDRAILTDPSGRVITLHASERTIDAGTVPEGFYTFTLWWKDAMVASGRLLLVR
ncbi:MAG: hypothetical protein H6595_03585 [Flavobacteriales bacterium]|nr:hypothetical protein [Flavobacteriales bacterium]MCB9166541.1 hypothetical protein [Flavobacteriales bacterium]